MGLRWGLGCKVQLCSPCADTGKSLSSLPASSVVPLRSVRAVCPCAHSDHDRRALTGSRMKIVVVKVLCLLGICVLMLVGSLLPVKVMEGDYEKAHRSRRVLALCNSFGGGVFLATCFNTLLPTVRGKVRADEPRADERFERATEWVGDPCASPPARQQLGPPDPWPWESGGEGSVSCQSSPQRLPGYAWCFR